MSGPDDERPSDGTGAEPPAAPPPAYEPPPPAEPPAYQPPAAPPAYQPPPIAPPAYQPPAAPPAYQPPPVAPPAYQPPPAYQAPADPTPPAYPAPGPSAAPYVPSQFPTATPYPGAPGAAAGPATPYTPYAGGPPGPPPGAPGQPPLYGPPPGAPGGPPARHQGRVVFAIVSVFALLLAGGFAVWSLTRPDGAADPETAVRNLFTAIDNEDVVGVMETLPPSERSIIVRDAVLDSISNLQRLGVLSDFDAHKVPGATFDVQNLQLTSSQLSSDVAAVTITGGTITASSNPANLPLGDLTRNKLQDDLSTAKSETSTEDLSKDHVRLATVFEKGGWHVSLFYSIAEAARGRSTPPPQFGQGPSPKGADTPDGAVQEMVRAGTDLDPQLAIQMLPPDEMRVVYDYSSLFLPDAQKAAADAKQDGYHGKVDRLDLRTEGDGDSRRVFANGFDVTIGDKHSEYRVTFDGQCYHATETILQRDQYSSRSGTDEQVCRDGTYKSNGTTSTTNARNDNPFTGMGGISSDVGITVVQVDGRWYVSPTRTLVDSLLNGLHNITRADLEKLLDGELFQPTSPHTSFSAVGSAIAGSGPYDPYPYGTAPSRGTTPGTASRRTTTTEDQACLDDPNLIECDDIAPAPSSTTTVRRSTTTTSLDDGSNGQGGGSGFSSGG